MDINRIIRLLGDPGKHAKICVALLCISYFFVVYNHLAMAIYGAKTPHHCKLPKGTPLNTSLPKLPTGKYDSCSQYVNGTNATTSCSNWEYTYGHGPILPEKNIVGEWDLVCDRRYLVNLASSLYFTGVLFGGLIFGSISDKLGRKSTVIFTLYTSVILGVMVFFVENFILFVILRFLIGVLMQGLQLGSYVLMIELFRAGTHRAYVAATFETFWSCGIMLLAGISWLFQDWRYIQLVICLSPLTTIVWIWFIPEPARWLLSRRRFKDAVTSLRKIARFNGVTLREDALDIKAFDTQEERLKETKQYNISHMFRTPKVRVRSFIMFYAWLATSFVYYGLSLNASGFAGNKYLNFFVGGAIEFPAYFSGIWILSRWGRRKPLAVYFFIGGAACIVAGVLPDKTASGEDIRWVVTVLAWVGKFSTAGCWSVIFLYAAELFPTTIRNIGVGACAVWARVGGVVAPQILTLGDYTEEYIPFLIFGVAAILGSVLTLFLPETLNTKLPETIEEAEGLEEINDDDKEEDVGEDNIAMT